MALPIDISRVTGTKPLPRKLSCALAVLLLVTVVVFICVHMNPLRIILFGDINFQWINNSLEFWNAPRSNGRDINSTWKNSSTFSDFLDHDGRQLASSTIDSSTCEPRTFQVLLWHKDLGSPETINLPCQGHCVFTTDISRYESSDAVVFQGDRMSLETFPRNRSRHQKWVYRSMEPPTNIFPYSMKMVHLRRQRELYNLTSTYESTSDVPTPYFDGRCSIERGEAEKMNETERRMLLELISKKTRPIAWFVTHCSTSSRRERYVSQLRRYIPVDIFGGCGDLRCPLQATGNVFSNCDDLLDSHYRFYLSFENSLCTDYITEKFWRLLHRDVIPITLSAADYRKHVPQGTYVDVRDFRSPRHLAEYLWTLTRRDDLYAAYLERKRGLTCTSTRPSDFATRLCYYLFRHADLQERTDLSGRWNLTKTCRTPKEFYGGIAETVEMK